MTALYPFQRELAAAAIDLISKSKRVMLQLPTGGGKTVIAGAILKNLDRSTLFLSHRTLLLEQGIEKLEAMGIPRDTMARLVPRSEGEGIPFWAKTMFSTIQTLTAKGRLDEVKKLYGPPELIVVDEAHHIASKTYRGVLAQFPDIPVLGLTATPERADGKGFDEIFTHMLVGPSTRELINAGFLCDYEMLTQDLFEDSKGDMKILGGDYRDDHLDQAITSKIIRQIRSAILEHAGRRKGILFMPSIRSSKAIVEHCRQAGISIGHVDGKMHRDEQRRLFDAFREGKLDFLSSVGLIEEGFDVPDCDCIIDATPTKSLRRFLQKVGRGLRYQEKKVALILDLAGNHHEFSIDGLSVCARRKWRLEGTAGRKTIKKKKEPLPEIIELEKSELELEIEDEMANLVNIKEYGEGFLRDARFNSLKRGALLKRLIRGPHPHREIKKFAAALGYKPGWAYFELQKHGLEIPKQRKQA